MTEPPTEDAAALSDKAEIDSPTGGKRHELPLSEFQADVEKCVGKLGGRVKQCGRNAFHHLRRAWALYGVDNEMSAFRAITAEEEAAAALILSIQQKGYPGASHLNIRDHRHKAALIPFLDAVARVLALMEFVEPTLHLSPDADPPRLAVRLNVRRAGLKSNEPLVVAQDEPLNFTVNRETTDGGRVVHDFEEQLREVTQGSNLSEIKDYVRKQANLRNELLYASESGIPSAIFREAFLLERLRRVTVLLTLTVAIQQTPMHQRFVVQCMHAFLRALRTIDSEPVRPAEEDAAGLRIFVEMGPDREPVTSFERRYTFETLIHYRFLPVIHVGWNYTGAMPTRSADSEPG